MFGKLRRLVLALAAADAAAVQLALWLADYFRRTLPLGRELGAIDTFLNPAIHLLVLVIFPAVFVTLSVYDVRRDTRPVGDARTLVLAVSASTFVFAGMLYFTFRDFPRLAVAYFFFITLAVLALVRLGAALGLRLMHASGRSLSRVLLVGAGASAEAVARVIGERLSPGVQIVGCADSRATAGPFGLPVLGTLADVPALVRRENVDEVIIALPGEFYPQIEALAYALQPEPVRVRLVPDFLKLVVVQSSVESLGGLPLIGLREPRIDGPAWAIKRLFDLVLASFCLGLTWPFLLIIAAAVKIDSPGPALFRHRRVGENGRLFHMFKFRTMVVGAEGLPRPGRKGPDDPRVTRLGRFLRRFSLDELPQLLNVLQGEMSLVGPRPEQISIVEAYEPWQRQRLAVPPGITGWWQVNGRSDLPMHLNTQYDLYYIRNYSLWLDLKILWKTVGVVIRGEGAY